MVKYLAYGWSARRGPARRCTTRSRAALAAARYTGWDGLLAEQRDVPRRLLGRRRRRDRRRRRAAAGRPVRALPRAAGRRPGRAAARSRAKGLTGAGLRRPHLLGHRDVRAAGAHATPRPTRPADALRWRQSTLPLAQRAGRAARPGGRGVPVADDPRRGVLGLLAGGHRRVPHQRRHRRRRASATSTPPATTEFEREVGARAAGRDGAAVALARPPRPPAQLPHRRRHRARRVQRDRRQQRLHQPDGAAEPARRRRRRGRAPASARPRSASTPRRWRAGATRPTAMTIPYDEELGVHPQREGFTEHAALGLREHAAGALPAAAALSRTSTSTASRSSSRPTWCWRCSCAATRSPPSRRRATSPTTRRSRCATRRCRRAPRR